jgi:hypothetical protein
MRLLRLYWHDKCNVTVTCLLEGLHERSRRAKVLVLHELLQEDPKAQAGRLRGGKVAQHTGENLRVALQGGGLHLSLVHPLVPINIASYIQSAVICNL